MNDLTLVVNNRDANALRKLAQTPQNSNPELNRQKARTLFNELFKQLRVMFPATVSAIKSQAELDELRSQWVLAFIENGIHTIEQINAGLVEARKQSTPFLPSPGQFIQWCQYAAFGLPDVDSIIEEFNRYCANRLDYSSPTLFPWTHPVMYWIVTELRQKMVANNETSSEVRKRAGRLLTSWSKKVSLGMSIPEPVNQLENKQRPASIAEQMGDFERYKQLGEQYRLKRKAVSEVSINE